MQTGRFLLGPKLSRRERPLFLTTTFAITRGKQAIDQAKSLFPESYDGSEPDGSPSPTVDRTIWLVPLKDPLVCSSSYLLLLFLLWLFLFPSMVPFSELLIHWSGLIVSTLLFFLLVFFFFFDIYD